VTGPTFVDTTSHGKRLRRGAKLWTVSGSTFKASSFLIAPDRLPTCSPQAL
jgi:hypothetical protein